jgi:hypothetical protein
LQFSLSALLLLVTMAGVISYVFTRKPGLLLFLHLPVVVGLPSLPLFPAILPKHENARRSMGGYVLAAGVLLALHLAATVGWVHMLLREPFTLDFVPFDSLVSATLNWTIPSTFGAVLIAIALPKTTCRNVGSAIGGILLAGVSVGFVLYGDYFFGEILGFPLREHVWWL